VVTKAGLTVIRYLDLVIWDLDLLFRYLDLIGLRYICIK